MQTSRQLFLPPSRRKGENLHRNFHRISRAGIFIHFASFHPHSYVEGENAAACLPLLWCFIYFVLMLCAYVFFVPFSLLAATATEDETYAKKMLIFSERDVMFSSRLYILETFHSRIPLPPFFPRTLRVSKHPTKIACRARSLSYQVFLESLSKFASYQSYLQPNWT